MKPVLLALALVLPTYTIADAQIRITPGGVSIGHPDVHRDDHRRDREREEARRHEEERRHDDHHDHR